MAVKAAIKAPIKIGELARRTGATVETIRYTKPNN